jgi:hypothetical protein
MIASPHDLPPLDAEREFSNLKHALATLIEHRLVSLDRLESATLTHLQRRLRETEYHIFHFIGHGAFDVSADDGILLLESDQGRAREVGSQYLGALLHDHRSLRLVLLNSCEGGRSGRRDPFAGTAQSLVQQGVPAVLAMQFEISDQAAIAFAQEFYASLATGYPIDASLSEARKAIFSQVSQVEWATPVLFMRSLSGDLFDIQKAHVTVAGAAALAPASSPLARSISGHIPRLRILLLSLALLGLCLWAGLRIRAALNTRSTPIAQEESPPDSRPKEQARIPEGPHPLGKVVSPSRATSDLRQARPSPDNRPAGAAITTSAAKEPPGWSSGPSSRAGAIISPSSPTVGKDTSVALTKTNPREEVIQRLHYRPTDGYVLRILSLEGPRSVRHGDKGSFTLSYAVIGPNALEGFRVKMFRGFKFQGKYVMGDGPSQFDIPQGGGVVTITFDCTVASAASAGTYVLTVILEGEPGHLSVEWDLGFDVVTE